MSLEEIINSLNDTANVLDSMSRMFPAVKPNERTIAIRAAIEKLKTHPDNQPNEPLTLEDLWEIEGQPVWATSNGIGRWCIVWIFNGSVHLCALRYDINAVEFMSFGGEIYRRPPEEDQG